MNKKQTIALILISLLYFTTHLYKIESFPHYFNDESFYHQLSLNIKNQEFYQGPTGKWYVDIYGLKYFPHEHPPLHFILTLPFLSERIVSIRIINVVINFAIMILIFLILKRIKSVNTGLLGALIWSIYPFGIYMNRVNFPQTSLALFSLTFILSMLYNRKYLAILSIVAATLSQYAGILLIIPFIRIYKKKSYAPIAVAATLGMFYSAWAIDSFVIQQIVPTLERFVLLWPIAIAGVILIVIGYVGYIYRKYFYYDHIKPILDKSRELYYKIHPAFWVGLFTYLIVYYLVVRPINIYSWYSFGVNIFYIGIIGLFFTRYKTILYSFAVLQLFMLILNRGDHISIIVQPLIIIGFTLLFVRIHNELFRYRKHFTTLMIIVAVIMLFKVNAYIPEDSEDLQAFDSVIIYINSLIDNDTCVMTQTKFSTRIKSQCVTDILLPCAYEHGNCVYRHIDDKAAFNYNISYYNMKHVIVKEEGLDFLKKWGEKNNASMFEVGTTIESWPKTKVGNITIFVNPRTNLSFGKFGDFRIYYRKLSQEGKTVEEIIGWNETKVEGYTVYDNPSIQN